MEGHRALLEDRIRRWKKSWTKNQKTKNVPLRSLLDDLHRSLSCPSEDSSQKQELSLHVSASSSTPSSFSSYASSSSSSSLNSPSVSQYTKRSSWSAVLEEHRVFVKRETFKQKYEEIASSYGVLPFSPLKKCSQIQSLLLTSEQRGEKELILKKLRRRNGGRGKGIEDSVSFDEKTEERIGRSDDNDAKKPAKEVEESKHSPTVSTSLSSLDSKTSKKRKKISPRQRERTWASHVSSEDSELDGSDVIVEQTTPTSVMKMTKKKKKKSGRRRRRRTSLDVSWLFAKESWESLSHKWKRLCPICKKCCKAVVSSVLRSNDWLNIPVHGEHRRAHRYRNIKVDEILMEISSGKEGMPCESPIRHITVCSIHGSESSLWMMKSHILRCEDDLPLPSVEVCGLIRNPPIDCDDTLNAADVSMMHEGMDDDGSYRDVPMNSDGVIRFRVAEEKMMIRCVNIILHAIICVERRVGFHLTRPNIVAEDIFLCLPLEQQSPPH